MPKERHDRAEQKCHEKAQEFQQGYQKVREGTKKSGAVLQTCCFYNKLRGILVSEHTSTPQITVDISQEPEAETTNANSKEEERDTHSGELKPPGAV